MMKSFVGKDGSSSISLYVYLASSDTVSTSEELYGY